MASCQLALFYSPTGEVVRLISYHSKGHARRCADLAMKWLNPDRFHWTILEGAQRLPNDFIGVPSVETQPDSGTT